MRASLLLSSVVAAALATANTASAEITPLENWRSMRSANFLLLGDVGEGDLRRVAAKLEQFREAVGVILPKATVTTSTPTTVIVFRSHARYRPFKPVYKGKPAEHIAGYFLGGGETNFVTLTIESRGADPDEALRIVYHELVHLMVSNTVRGVPAWFNEGLAEYYRMLDVTDGGRRVTVGRVHPPHVLLLRGQFIPLEALAAVDRGSPLYNEASKASIFYAESWALVHYLLINDMVQKTTRATALLRALTNGVSFAEACRQALGLSVAQLENALRSYVRQDRFTSMNLRLMDRLDAIDRLPASPASPVQVHATLGTLLRYMGRQDEAREHLAFAVSAGPSDSRALTEMGALLVRDGRHDEARALLEKAAAAPDATAFTYYHLAAAWRGREGRGAETDADKAAEAALRRAIALDPALAQAHAELARLLSQRTDAGREPFDLIQKAIALAPAREDYMLHFAYMLANRRMFADARTVLTSLAAHAANDEIRRNATSLLAGLADADRRQAEGPAAPPARAASADPGDRAIGWPAGQRPALRRVEAGEEQISGVLLAIDCPRGGIRLIVKREGAQVRVHARAFDAIDFISYRDDLRGALGCGAREAEDPVLVTYRPAPADDSLGEVVAVEFVPVSGRRP